MKSEMRMLQNTLQIHKTKPKNKGNEPQNGFFTQVKT